MSYRLIYTDSYIRRAKKFLKRHPQVLGQYEKTLQLLELNPHHPSLRLHGLQGALSGLSSVSITMSYRIVLEFVIQDRDIILIDVGNHDHVY
ncbi:plasmid stabilization protein [Marinimicrobium sp. ABcell2]|uniref:type II toxin-antitoxin system RelE/ParE family toxin n=1 Tax=Marinimicrobium sp. ABcell2 TaxID=3069751 RepID=UPI0027B02FBA|nr:plasmid stabilization protein [Marinimicrobium sp. ABcell2]MDQ2077083.1 plasmid stabilization protein [Marinimicrobium sp. ABcell2]